MSENELREAVKKHIKVVFDLDGTLANCDDRIQYLNREKKDWRAFYAACDTDRPYHAVIRVLHALWMTGAEVEIWTGRSGEVSEKTRRWLDENGMGMIPLKMREEGDHRPDTVIKEEWLDACDAKPTLVFEDRASVVAMWRSHGITCCQVREGDF